MTITPRTLRHAVVIAALAATGFALAACGQAPEHAGTTENMTSVDIKEESAPPAIAPVDASGSGPIAVSVPRIAYTYSYTYRIAAERIAQVQTRQVELCEKQGPQVCRVLDMRSASSEGDGSGGSMTLAVAAPKARAFGAKLGAIVGNADGEAISSEITGEDLSKQIVDTTARLKARTVLRDRLMEILATRQGKVAELVEAERGVAKVNEEIDQARSWLAEMQGRVNYSEINLTYVSQGQTTNAFLSPILAALGSLGSILGTVIGALIVVLAVGVPLGLAIWALAWLVRTIRQRTEA